MSIMVWSFFLLLTDFTKVAPARHITDQEWFQSQWWDKTLSWANIAFSTSCFWTACTSMMSTVRGLGSVESVGMEALNDPWISCLYTPSRRRGPPFTSTFMFYILRLGNITLASLKPWSSEPFSIYCSELNWYYIYIYRYQELTSRLPFACRCVSSSASCRCNSTTCDSCAWSANQKDCKDAKVRALWISSIPFRKIHRHHVISFQCSSLLIFSYIH